MLLEATMRFALMLVLALLFPATAMAQDANSHAPVERLRLLWRIEETSTWLGSPVAQADGTLLVWSWLITPPDETDGVDGMAFLDQIDCSARTYRRVRRELYAGPTLTSAIPASEPFVEAAPFVAESNIIAFLCPAAGALPSWSPAVEQWAQTPLAARSTRR
jgi:hypothetical protein